jgi:tetratricopeptide (TPR) repeat protein
MKRYLILISVVAIASLTAIHILNLWRGVSHSRRALTQNQFLMAAQIDLDNPDPLYQLSVLHQWDLRHMDLGKSNDYLQQAIKRTPLQQDYWLHLATIFQNMGQKEDSERALEKALFVFPTGYRGRWIAGNLLLQQGAPEKALPHFSYILAHYPEESRSIYDLWEMVAKDPDFILEKLIPKDYPSIRRYLTYLYEERKKERAQKVWKWIESLGYQPSRKDTIRHIEFLITQGDLKEAFHLWRTKVAAEGIPLPTDGNLINNPGFEIEASLGSGFDWTIDQTPGAEVSIDHSVAFEGKSSLKIQFNGSEDIDFHHVYQWISWKPHTDYQLKVNMKTEGVTTESGPRMEVSGIDSALYGVSESLTGDNDWKELRIAFRTPAQSQGGLLRVRRQKTKNSDRVIPATIWIDQVRLFEGGTGHD